MKIGFIVRGLCLGILVMLCMGQSVSQAKYGGEYLVYADNRSNTAYSLEDAFKRCYEAEKGEVHILSDECIDLEGAGYVVTSNMKLVISQGAYVTIDRGGLQVDGEIVVKKGVLDLQNSTGELYGNGKVECSDKGQYIKRKYGVQKSGDVALVGQEIWRGQRLSQATIREDKVIWRSSIAGKWEYVEEEYIPDVGTQFVDVRFVPDNPLMYDSVIYEKAGSVTVYSQKVESQNEIISEDNSNKNMVVSENSITSKEPIIITQMVSKKSTIVSKVKKKKAPKVRKIKRKKTKLSLLCEKRKNCLYEIQYGTSKKIRSLKKRRFKSSSITIQKLKKNKKYYFKVRTYNKKTKQYSKWSTLRCI